MRWVIAILIVLSVNTSAGADLIASWYSINSLKKEGTYKTSKGVMANGKIFDEQRFTCATRDWPLGTWLLVTNLRNNRSVKVKVTDKIAKRFKGKRLDLSKGAFSALDDLDRGLIPIKVEII